MKEQDITINIEASVTLSMGLSATMLNYEPISIKCACLHIGDEIIMLPGSVCKALQTRYLSRLGVIAEKRLEELDGELAGDPF